MERQFRALCHEIARRTGGTFAGFRRATGATPSFHQGLIAYPDRTVAVVCDRAEPLLAVAEPRDLDGPVRDSGPLTFLEAPALDPAPGFRVLSKAELDSPFVPAEWPRLSARDVEYWRPATLGEALFNYWD